MKKLSLIDLVNDPIVVESIDNYEEITEKVLKQIILNNVPKFLNELGNGFALLGS